MRGSQRWHEVGVRVSGPNCGGLHLHSQLLVICHIEILPLLLLALDSSRSDVLVRSDVLCRGGSEQRVIRPATGYSIVPTRRQWARRAVFAGHCVCWKSWKFWNKWKFVIYLCLLIFFFDENFLKGGMHLLCMNSTVVTVALPAAGSFPKIKLNLFVWNKLDFVKVF